LANNVVGYTVYGDYRQDSPPAHVVEAVANGEVDLAVVWGPLAGYFAKKQAVPLAVVPVSPAVEPPGLPFAFDISVGVKKGDQQLRDELNHILARRRSRIARILDEYGVPRADEPAESAARAQVP
jgi:mxaJ protein